MNGFICQQAYLAFDYWSSGNKCKLMQICINRKLNAIRSREYRGILMMIWRECTISHHCLLGHSIRSCTSQSVIKQGNVPTSRIATARLC